MSTDEAAGHRVFRDRIRVCLRYWRSTSALVVVIGACFPAQADPKVNWTGCFFQRLVRYRQLVLRRLAGNR